MRLKTTFSAALVLLGASFAYAQDSGYKTLPLDDMSAFRPQAGNWKIVGEVWMDPEIDIHAHKETIPAESGKKKKKIKPVVVTAQPEAVTYTAGKGVLLNMNDDKTKDNLLTSFEHGDIDLDLEVMIPKGSNSGIYLQGRYEVQLLDSWGVRNPKYSDIGGIYRNWETSADKIYMGKAPISNPAKAAGLWQKMKISFRAPRFDAAGNKIANARFESVELNGVKIHDHLEVPLPTGGPIDSKEAAIGPLMIQGDHGPVAFRNIRYKLLKDLKTSLGPVSYKVYHGAFNNISDFITLKPVYQGNSTGLSAEVLDIENAYGVVYTGTLTVPEKNTYNITIGFTGGIKFVLDGKALLDLQRDDWRYSSVKATLDAGTYPYEIYSFKNSEWMPPRLSLIVGTDSSYPQTLTDYNSYPPDDNPTSDILIHAGSQPKMLRAFLDYKRDRKQRLTHTIGVSEPAGINYVYDLDDGNLVCVWRGDFVDATPMWHDRGDGSFRPLGATLYLPNTQPLAFIASATDAFPATGKEGGYRAKGYRIEESTSRPIFSYSYLGLDVTDKIYPSDEDRSFTHEITLKDRGTKAGLHYKLAEGNSIVKMANGSWSIDQQYFIKIKGNVAPMVRESNGKKELVVPFETASLQYSIIW